MPSLILLNGPPAAGKSTLAQIYVDDHPLALTLDIDKLRAMIGGWQQHRGAAGALARVLALAAARAHLMAGHDVVVPQLIGRVDFIVQLESAAADTGAEFREVFLLPDEQSALLLYRERARALASQQPPDPVVSTDQTASDLARTYAELLAVLYARPAAVVVRIRVGQLAEAYQALLGCLE